MNDDKDSTRDQIEQATSRTMPDQPLEHETSALRDGWLALGRSLEAAGQQFDHESVAASLQAELIDQHQRVQPAVQATNRSWWSAILSTALALAMLLAVIRSLPRGAIARPGDELLWATNSRDEGSEPGSWSDPLDDQIDDATAQVQALAAQSPGIDDSLLGISQQLESMSDELSHGSL